ERNPYAKLDIYKTPKPGAGLQQSEASTPAPMHSAPTAPSGPATSPLAPRPQSTHRRMPANELSTAQQKSLAAAHGASPAAPRPPPAAKPAPNVTTTLVQGHAATGTPRPIPPKAASQTSVSSSATSAGQQQSP